MNTQRYVGAALVAIALVAVVAFAGVNVAAVAPFVIILLICALLIFFIMRGMNHDGSDQDDHPAHTGARPVKRAMNPRSVRSAALAAAGLRETRRDTPRFDEMATSGLPTRPAGHPLSSERAT